MYRLYILLIIYAANKIINKTPVIVKPYKQVINIKYGK